MSRLQHYDIKRTLPARQINDPNAQTIDLGNIANLPVCVSATADLNPLFNGSPGPTLYLTWHPVGNTLWDRWNFIGASDTQNIRIPVDGFYDFWYMAVINNPAPTGNFSIRSTLELATTSDSGFTTPSFSTIVFGPATYFDGALLQVGGMLRWEVLYRGILYHANDLIRFGLNMYNDPAGPVANQNISVVNSEFKFSYATPNDQVTQGGP